MCVHPQRGHKPLTERYETWEAEEKLEKTQLKERYTEAFVNSLTNEGVKNELRTLGVRSVAEASAKDTLIRVGRNGSRVGELRLREKGRPNLGGEFRAHTPTAYYFSEYLTQCLLTYASGESLWAEGKNDGELSSDLGIRSCPDG